MRTYADLLALYENTEPWQPPAAQPTDRPADRDLDEFPARQIAAALEIDVLGHREGGTIEIYSFHYRRTDQVKDHDRLRYSRALQIFGHPGKRVITKTAEDVPGMYSISDVRDMLGLLSSPMVITDETKRGFGVWPNSAADGLVLVNLGEGLHLSPAGVQRIEHPRHEDLLLNFSSGRKAWYDHNTLLDHLKQAESPEWRENVASELVALWRRWNWRGKQDVLLVTALTFATWIQTLWPWRPRIDVLGASGSGKTMFCEALMGLFRDMTISTYDTSAAGLRQEMRKSAMVVVVDEVDTKNRREAARQREILKMLRSASRSSGARAIRGTPGGEATSFTLHHLCWLAGISLPYEDQADRNRAIILNLLTAAPGRQNKLRLPSADDLGAFGARSLAAALSVAHTACRRASDLKDLVVEGVDPRQVESYAVPAAMLSAILGQTEQEAYGLLREMLSDASDSGESIEPDEVILVKSILGAQVQLEQQRLTVGQVLEILPTEVPNVQDGWRSVLAGAGIRVDEARQISFLYQQVSSRLLKGTRWEGQEISQYLRRLPGAASTRQRVGGLNGRCARFDLGEFLDMFAGERSEDAELGSRSFSGW